MAHTHMDTHAQQFKCLANLLALSEIAEVSFKISNGVYR